MFSADRYFKLHEQSLSADLLLIMLVVGFAKNTPCKTMQNKEISFLDLTYG